MGLTLRELAQHPVTELRDVGPKLQERLAMLGIESALDLLQHYPRRYIDRRARAAIAELEPGVEATVDAEVQRITARRTRRGRPVVEATVSDGESLLSLVFFNQSWRQRQLPVGTEASFFGKVELYRGRRRMVNPAVDVLGRHGEEQTGVIVPVYPQSGKAEIFSWQVRRLVAACLAKTRVKGFADPLDEDLRRELRLEDRTRAYRGIHRPETGEDHRRAAHRLKFDEFLRMQVGLVARKRALEAERTGIRHRVEGPLVDAFLDRLPFGLTGDQRRAIDEIARDLASPVPMHRLLQGDVGSGKTVIALCALLMAVQGGYQGALMAPTEVLAEQHHLGISGMLEGLTVPSERTLAGDRPVRVALLTNRTGAAERRRLAADLADGEVDVVVGTHALIYGEVAFARLGVAVVDEQHRFGVEQRALLRGMGEDPDVLVMTATPIPGRPPCSSTATSTSPSCARCPPAGCR
ncbi:MAG: DEAD/DEAH box helicase [Acidimicrobiia bacterium]|nr:DEAD/DEAH box helicase [Acidimicrobiia bacterium]